MVTVGVAIATYNRAAMVRQAIEAALAQSMRVSEIVVTDDASTDDTWAALSELASAEPRLRIFRQASNSGGVENWNFAVAKTQSDYIAWCSDDDRFLPDHLQVSVDYLETHRDVGFVHSGFVDAVETEAGTELSPRPLRFPETRIVNQRDLLRYLTRYYDWPFHPSTIVMRREVWERVCPFNAAYALADTDWFVRAVERFPAALLARQGVLNRRHAGNWSNRLGSARMQGEIFQIVEAAIERRWPHGGLRNRAWKAVWRANVRFRLTLTLRKRLQSGHGQAACDVWRQLLQGTGRRAPEFLEKSGKAIIQQFCGRKKALFDDVRQSVSPL